VSKGRMEVITKKKNVNRIKAFSFLMTHRVLRGVLDTTLGDEVCQ
jgi:hypothetical protein